MESLSRTKEILDLQGSPVLESFRELPREPNGPITERNPPTGQTALSPNGPASAIRAWTLRESFRRVGGGPVPGGGGAGKREER